MNSKNNQKRNLKYWFWNLLNFKKPFCTLCGCELEAKQSEELESCEAGKWEAVEE